MYIHICTCLSFVCLREHLPSNIKNTRETMNLKIYFSLFPPFVSFAQFLQADTNILEQCHGKEPRNYK